MQESLPRQEVVLLGVGHTNAHVLRMWKMHAVKDTRLTCISNFSTVTYSGMLPGVLAGQYEPDRMRIDLVRLCAAVGARLIVDLVTGLDLDRQQLLFGERPPLPFDVLSIGIGSVPTRDGVQHDGTLMPIKPMQSFLARFESRIKALAEDITDRPLQICVVGAGVGGIEITCCLPRRLTNLLGEGRFEISLVSASDEVGIGLLAQTKARIRQELVARGVQIVSGSRVSSVRQGQLTLQNGKSLAADLVLWAASASAPELLPKLNLPTDERGFLLTQATLQSTSGAPVFAVGDTGTIEGAATPKAGVYAVRQGKYLWRNIQHLLRQEPLESYVPQTGFLKLINTGDGQALAEYRGMCAKSAWWWKLKDRIDSRFMDKYQNYEPMQMDPIPPDETAAMRCAGCGGKVGGDVLSRVLKRLDVPTNEHVVLGLEAADDVAIVRPPAGRPVSVTADFFTAPLADSYLSGRIAALNSASDLFATGAQPFAALTMATIPVGKPRQQEQVLYELMAGSLLEFRRMNTALVGGHTIEGPRTTIGFTMLADQQGKPLTKGDLLPGDRLVLTKPLGSGVLLAAHMQAACQAEWMDVLLQVMLESNQQAAGLASRFPIHGMTDVTGFGLAGHLLEMLRASDCSAQLDLEAIQILPGAEQLSNLGVESTLAPANRVAESEIQVSEAKRRTARYNLLFDPQTSGGILLGVDPAAVSEVLAELTRISSIPASVIGTVTARSGHDRQISL